MKKLKNLKKMWLTSNSLFAKIGSTSLRIIAPLFIFFSFMFFTVKAPEIHSLFLRAYVGDKVYLITNDTYRGSGTGFAIKAPSGLSYIVTNDHICEVSSDGENLVIIDRTGWAMRRRIIERSKYSDLCILEGFPGVEGLSMGSEPSIGQVVASVGHPSGYDLTLSRGEVIQHNDVTIMYKPISVTIGSQPEHQISEEDGGMLESECSLPKNRLYIQEDSVIFFTIKTKLCLNVTKSAYTTNMLIQPGSSGSPMINFFGNVVGVMFAADRAYWGAAVSFNDLTDFLRNY